MQSGKFLAGKTQFYAPQWVGLDQVDEFPQNFARGQLLLDAANRHGRNDALQEPAYGAGEAHIHLRDPQLDVAVGALIGKIDIVYADDFASAGVDDLLVEEVLADREPCLIWMVQLESSLIRGQRDSARYSGRNLVVSGDERPILAAADQHSRDAVRLVRRFDEDFLDAPDVIAQRIECLGSDDFRCVQHEALLGLRATWISKRRSPSGPAHRRTIRKARRLIAEES